MRRAEASRGRTHRGCGFVFAYFLQLCKLIGQHGHILDLTVFHWVSTFSEEYHSPRLRDILQEDDLLQYAWAFRELIGIPPSSTMSFRKRRKPRFAPPDATLASPPIHKTYTGLVMPWWRFPLPRNLVNNSFLTAGVVPAHRCVMRQHFPSHSLHGSMKI